MVRTGAAAFLSIFLLVIESFIVMKIKDYSSIYFGNTQLLISVLVMNFFFSFAILTNIKMWIDNRSTEESEVEMK